MIDLGMDDAFFRLLFKVIPVGIVMIDENGVINAINPEGSKMFCVDSLNDSTQYRAGELFRCINAKYGCGTTIACQDCILRKNANMAIHDKKMQRQKGKFCTIKDNDIKQFVLQVTALPLIYQKNTRALLIIEDVSLITELSGLIPICSSCHSIRNDNGDWVNIAKYLQEHSEAELTHDYCPECLKQIESFKKVNKSSMLQYKENQL